jgi:hypothetical protein
VPAVRYVHLVFTSLPCFVLFALVAAAGVPIPEVLVATGCGVIVGALVFIYFLRSCRRQLLLGRSDFLSRRPPGGFWFFVLMGLIGAILSIPIGIQWGLLGLRLCAIGGSVALLINFAALGAYVALLERKRKSKVFLDTSGLFFLDDS